MTARDPLDGMIRESLSTLVAYAPQAPDFDDLSPEQSSGVRRGPLLVTAAVAVIALAVGGVLWSRSGDTAVTSGAADPTSGATDRPENAVIGDRNVGAMSPDELAAEIAAAAAPSHDLEVISAVEREIDAAFPDAGTLIEMHFAVEGGRVSAYRQRFDERPPDDALASGNDYEVEQLPDSSELITISPNDNARAQAIHFRADGIMINLIASGEGVAGVTPMTAQELGGVLRTLSHEDSATESGANGTLAGTLQLVGGPYGADPVPIPGTVEVQRVDSEESLTVPTTSDGRFRLDLQPGEYQLIGRSPQYNAGGAPCRAYETVEVRAGETSDATVACPMR